MQKPTGNSNKEVSENKEITLFLAGDLMTGRGIDQVLPHSVDPVLYEPYVKNARQYVQYAEQHSGHLPPKISHRYIWGESLSILKKINPDLRVINLETAITTNDDPWPGKEIHYRMHPANVDLLKEADIDLATLGNNHTMDWGIDGLKETLTVLESRNIHYCGAGFNEAAAGKPAIFTTENGRLLIFSYTTASAGTPPMWRARSETPGVNFLDELGKTGAKKVLNDVKKYRLETDRIVISVHWGRNWGYVVPKEQRNFARFLIDNGAADLIFGHSSHHPKQVEVYKSRLIIYGCGDLINDYEGISGQEEYRSDLSLMYFPTLKPSGELKALKMSPMNIHRFQLKKAEEADKNWLMEQLNEACKKFGTHLETSGDGFLELHWNHINLLRRLKDLI